MIVSPTASRLRNPLHHASRPRMNSSSTPTAVCAGFLCRGDLRVAALHDAILRRGGHRAPHRDVLLRDCRCCGRALHCHAARACKQQQPVLIMSHQRLVAVIMRFGTGLVAIAGCILFFAGQRFDDFSGRPAVAEGKRRQAGSTIFQPLPNEMG